MTQRKHSRTAEPTTSTSATEQAPADGSSNRSADRVALTDRRGVLKVAGVVVGAGALAACSSPPVPDASAASASSSSPPAGPSSSGATSEATTEATSGASSTASGGGTPASEVPVGGAKFFPDTKTVVTQPAAGTFKAFDTTCPHQGCAVSSVADNQIVCPCHQSHFDLSTGEPTPESQAKRPLTAKQVTVTGDTFTVA